MPSSVDHTPLPTPTQTDDRGVRLEAAGRWLEAELAGRPVPPLLVVIGLGDGELLDVLDARAPATKVLALEPDAAVAIRFQRRADLHRRRETGRLVYLADPDYAGADDAWRVFPTGSDAHTLIVSPAVARDAGPGAVRAARAFKQILFGVTANAEARRRFAPGYLAGSLHNLPEIVAGQDVRGLTDVYRGVPALIAAAGPSLDAALDDLAFVRDRAVLFAADTALRPLLTRGFSPEFAVAVDPQATNARHFHALPACPETWLVSETSIDPSVVRPFGRRTFWFRVANHEPWSWYHELGVDVGQIDVWGSVLTAAFQVAVLAGCDPIVIVGADLSFTGGRPYCRGTTYEFDWAHDVASGRAMAHAWRPFLKPDEQIRVPDLHGAETTTTAALQSFRDWMVARAKRSGRRVINATGAGILFGDGVEQLSLRDALPNPRAVASPRAIARKAPSSTSRSELAHRLWDVHRSVCRNAQATPPLDRWKAFSGEGFDLEAIGAAVERAARVLERPEAAPASETEPSVIPWSGLPASGAARRVASHVPEGIARLRAVLGGVEPGPAAGGHNDHVALVGEAFEILRAICAAAVRADDLAHPVPADHLGRTPLGALETWPVEIGWAVRLFEALLGEAWAVSVPLPAAEGSFFARHVTLRDVSAGPAVGDEAHVPRPHVAQACANLALEWLMCVRQLEVTSGPERARSTAWWRSFAVATAPPGDARVTGAPVALVLESGSSIPIELPLAAGEGQFARVLTGAMWLDAAPTPPLPPAVSPLARVHTPSHVASIGIRIGGGTARRAGGPLLVPRVLTDEGVVRGVVPYSTDAGAVCTVLRGSESFLVRENGAIEPGVRWPRPINGQLPFGDGGAVAWSVGTARWPDGGSGYVMSRTGPNDEPTIEPLPFAPQAGTWWRGRLYWACFPFGVGSWAPGEAPAFALPDLTLFSVQGDDTDLVLGPRARTTYGAAERRLVTEGWRWQPGHAPQAAVLGPHGVASSRAASADWTAIAYPEADLVQLEHAGGVVVSMRCYYPFTVAWAGRSLLVSTADGELLLFEHLKDVMDRMPGGGGR
jgi:hypothetical protein